MDAKITLGFRADIISQAKIYGDKHGISLSRLIENLLSRLVRSDARHFDQFPISDWVMMAAEGNIEYQSKIKSNKNLRREFHEGRKKKS